MATTWTGKRQDGTVYSAVLNGTVINWSFGDKVATTDAPPKGAMVDLKAAGLNPATHVALHTVDGRVMVAPKEMVITICADLATPKTMSLEEQRQEIVIRIAAARDAAQAARTAAWEREDDRGGVSRNAHDTDAATAEAELAAFDAAHPEIKASIDVERVARADRNTWN